MVPCGFLFRLKTTALASALLLTPLLFSASAAAAPEKLAATFLLSNKSHTDLVGIRFIQPKTVSLSRLDLAPGSDEEVENPGGTAELRIDLGLSMCTWKNFALDGLKGVTLCPEHEGCILVTGAEGTPSHVRGECASLLPAPDAAPVCALDKFRPGMTMRDACGLINTAYTSDDSAYITTLGYAGLIWSARLYAGGSQVSSDITREQLEDIELRQTLSAANLKAVRDTLAQQDYIPWQATLPGMDLDFSDMESVSLEDRDKLLQTCIETFLKSGRGEASIMFAPKSLLPELTTADSPRSDIHLFTLILRRDSGTIILDMAAYTGEEARD